MDIRLSVGDFYKYGMETKMLLRDPEVYPSGEVLEEALGKDIYGVLERFLATITADGYGIQPEWRYYNDGKAWLGKLTYKKKTVLWLSVWEGYFKTSCFFTAKHVQAINALDIDDSIKQNFAAAKPSGKLIPMIFDVNQISQLPDLLTVIRFKMGLK